MTAFTLTQKRIKNVVIGVLAAWAAQVGMASAAPTVPGLMAGQFDVDSNGAATYTIPIEVPPGKGGMEPHLALKYNSQKGNGLLGVGWTLEGLGAIQRCGGNIGTDGVKSGIDKTAERFCWNGQRLINIPANSGHPLKDAFDKGCDGFAALAEYRTQIDTYVRVVSCGGTDAKNPLYFEVYTKDGQQLVFGRRPDSNIKVRERIRTTDFRGNVTWPDGTAATAIWALDYQSDRHGNTVQIFYTNQSSTYYAGTGTTGSYYPKSIIYFGPGPAGPALGVQFNYTGRTSGTNNSSDNIVTSLAGQSVKLAVRLASIDTLSVVNSDGSSAPTLSGTKVNSYNLRYAASPTTVDAAKGADRRSHISEVERCDRSGLTCLSATKFIPASTAASATVAFGASYREISGLASLTRFVDVDGDGTKDVVKLVGGKIADCALPPAPCKTYMSPKVNVVFSPRTDGASLAAPAELDTDAFRRADIEILDVNGDGLVDIIWGRAQSTLDKTNLTTQSAGDLVVRLGKLDRTGSSLAFTWLPEVVYSAAITYGLTDKKADGTYMYPAYAPLISSSLRRFNQFVDLDGDGSMEILRVLVPPSITGDTGNDFSTSLGTYKAAFAPTSDGSTTKLWTSAENVSQGIPCNDSARGLTTSLNRQCQVLDVDGDGNPDLVSAFGGSSPSTFNALVYYGNGKGRFKDLVTINNDALARLVDTSSTTNFWDPAKTQRWAESFSANNQFADLNGDGVLDLLNTSQSETTTHSTTGKWLFSQYKHTGDGNWYSSPGSETYCARNHADTGCNSWTELIVNWYEGYLPKITLTTTLARQLGSNSAANPFQETVTDNVLVNVPLEPVLSCPPTTDYGMSENSFTPFFKNGATASAASVSSGIVYSDYCYTSSDAICPSIGSVTAPNAQPRYVGQRDYAVDCKASYTVDSNFVGVSANNRYVDINGDGYLDLVSLQKTSAAEALPAVYAAFGVGDGSFTARIALLSLADTTADTTLVQAFEQLVDLHDMDGDGLTDIIVHTTTGLRVYYAKYTSPTRIITIDTNNGVTHNIEYARHSAIGTLPTAKTNQKVLANAGMYVVKNYRTGLGGVDSNVDMRYGAWVSDWKYGAGSMAWIAKTQTSLAPSRATKQVFATEWPYFGRVTESTLEKIPSAGCLLSGLTGDCTILGKTVTTPGQITRATTDGKSSLVYQVHVANRITTDDINQSTTETFSGYDIFGDATTVETSLPDGSGVINTNVYTRQPTLTAFLGTPQEINVDQKRTNASGENATHHEKSLFNVDGQITMQESLGLARSFSYYIRGLSSVPGMIQGIGDVINYSQYNLYRHLVEQKTDGISVRYSEYETLASGEFREKQWANTFEDTVYDRRNGQVKSVAAKNGSTTLFEYDDFGRLTLETRPDGGKTSIEFTTAGSDPDAYSMAINATQMAGAAYVVIATPKSNDGASGFPVKTLYDGFGRKMRVVTRAADGDRVYVDFIYDTWGRLISETKPYFVGSVGLVTTGYEYDLLDRTTFVRRSHAGNTTTTYGAFDATIKGRLITTTEQRGDVDLTTKRYEDSQGRSVKIIDATSIATDYVYTPFGDLKSITRNGTFLIGHEYDDNGRLKRTTDSDLGVSEFSFDPWNRLRWKKDAKNQNTVLDYYGQFLGRVNVEGWGEVSRFITDVPVSIQGPDWIGQDPRDSDGKLREVTGPNGFREQHYYDKYGRETAVITTINKQRYVTGITYDSFGRARDLSYPNGGPVIRHEYFPNGALKSVGELSDTGQTTPVWMATARDAAGRVTGESFGNNKLTGSRSYNAQFGLTETIQTGSLQNLSYNYDKLGNMTWRQDSRQGVREDFSYDNVNRLDVVKRNSSQTADFDFDISGHGNLIKNGLGTLNYSGSRLHAVNSVGSGNAVVALGTLGDTNQDKSIDASDVSSAALYAAGQTSAISDVNKPKADCVASGGAIDILDAVCIAKLIAASATPNMGYDNNGNLTSGQGRSVRYTPFDQTAAIDGVAASTSYGYDGNFNRITKQSSSAGVVTTTTYIGDLYEKTQTASGTEHRFYIYAGGRLVSLKKRETDDRTNLYYILNDHLGSVDVITNDSGAELVRMSFDAYGQRRNINWTAGTGIVGTSITTRGFTGAEMEDEVGLVHLGARMYDAKLGRFLSPDSIIPDVGNGQSLNRYSYVLNNPLSWVDPSGHVPQLAGIGDTPQQAANNGATDSYLGGIIGGYPTGTFIGISDMGGVPGGSVQGFGEGMHWFDPQIGNGMSVGACSMCYPLAGPFWSNVGPVEGTITAVKAGWNDSTQSQKGLFALEVVGSLVGPGPEIKAAREGVGLLEGIADAARLSGKRNGGAAELVIGDRVYTGVSGETTPYNDVVTGLLVGSRGKRADWHGGCAEIVCLDKALNDGADVSLGRIRAINVGDLYAPHKSPKPICDSCRYILDQLGVKY